MLDGAGHVTQLSTLLYYIVSVKLNKFKHSMHHSYITPSMWIMKRSDSVIVLYNSSSSSFRSTV